MIKKLLPIILTFLLLIQIPGIQAQINDSILQPDLKTELFKGAGFPYLPPLNPNPWAYRIPALAVTNTGTLLAICDRRNPTPADLPNDIDIVIRKSYDYGDTWTAEEIIRDRGPVGIGDCQLVVDRQTGTIFNFFVDRDGPGRSIRTYYMYSEDDGNTWSEDIRVDDVLGVSHELTAGPGNGIQLKNGKLIIPTYGSTTGGRVHFLYSDDHGLSWQRSETAGGPGLGEPTVVQLADDQLMFNCRNVTGEQKRGTMYTNSNGTSWTDVVYDDILIESEVQASFIRFTDTLSGFRKNRLLFSNPADVNNRKNLTIRISYDEGLTWENSKILYPDGAAYSSMVVLPNGDLANFYEKDWRAHPPLGIIFPDKLNYERFSLEDLTNGADSLRTCTPPVPMIMRTTVTGNSVTLNWNSFFGGEYLLQYRPQGASEWMAPGVIDPGFKLIDLVDGSYEARVKWTCKEGRSVYSTTDVFEIGTATPVLEEEGFSRSVYPNPAASGSLITLRSDEVIYSVTLIDVNGKSVHKHEILEFGSPAVIKLPSLIPGSYFLQLKTDKGIQRGTLIITH